MYKKSVGTVVGRWMGVNEWIESLFECPPPNSLWGTPKCFACRRRSLSLSLAENVSSSSFLLGWWEGGMLNIRSSVRLLPCPSLREYTSDPSWMEYSVLVQFFLGCGKGGRQADWLEGLSCFCESSNLIALLGFFLPKKIYRTLFLCKINGPVDWAAARAKISLGFSVISRAGPFVQGVKKERSFLWQWKHANLFSVLCEMNGRRKCFWPVS